MSVLCVGQAAFDITGFTKDRVSADKKFRLDRIHECPGGPALNAACVCGFWGTTTLLAARVGDDERSRAIEESLARYGVDRSCVVREGSSPTTFSVIAVGPSGERTIFNCPTSYSTNMLPIPDLAPHVMLFDGHEPEASLEYLRMFPCAKSIIDAGTCRDSVLAVASEVDYLVCSESFASQYLGHQLSWGCEELAEDLASLQRIHGGEVIVTRGEGGLVYLSRGTSVAMPAFEVDAVDTTGAGDIFHGALAYGLDIDMELRDCLLLASMTAAISVTRCGGQTSIPPLDAVLHGLEHAGAPIDLRVLSSHQD